MNPCAAPPGKPCCNVYDPTRHRPTRLDARGTLRGPPLRLALDTNILAYAEGVGEEARRKASLDLIAVLLVESVVLREPIP